MNRDCENWTLFVILVTFSVNWAHGQTRFCDPVNSRPHPEGYCGPTLARLHRNFCYFMRSVYPDHFPSSKRSVGHAHGLRSVGDAVQHLRKRVPGIPLSLWASLDLSEGILWNPDFTKRATSNLIFPLDEQLLSPLDSLYWRDIGKDVVESPRSNLFRMFQKRSTRRKRNLVCDCCYNACAERKLAAYC